MRYAKALGLALIASLNLLAFTASSASAGETKGDFTYNGTAIGLNVNVDGELVNATESSLLFPDLNFGIACTAMDVQSGVLLPLSSGVSIGHVTVLFLGCLVFEHSELHFKLCKVFDEEGESGEGEITAAALVTVVRNKALGTAWVLASPSSGGILFDFEFGELCPGYGNEFIQMTGSVLFKVNGNKISEETNLATLQLFGNDGIVWGSQSSGTLDGEAEVLPIGAHTGGTVGVVAGH